MKALNIALVDDQLLFRQGIAALIHSVPDFSLVLQAENGADFLEKMKMEKSLPDLVLVDMEMPVMNGIELNEQMQKLYPDIKIIILSVHAKERLIAQMIHAGASGYLLKNCDKDELITAIRAVYTNGFYINEHTLKAIQTIAPLKNTLKGPNGIALELSVREREILLLICKEYSNIEIGQKLFISSRTVEGHRNNLLMKTGCRNTAGLVIFAVKSHIYSIIN
ncbi:response regulator transcription factor [Niabella sp. 22666]|uniref:response regulator transcription factor n=1 Tax=Niabella sp. 22666 TaxID=3453954 RepID=UPI003F877747